MGNILKIYTVEDKKEEKFLREISKDVSKEEIKNYCHDHLAAYKSPKIIEFYESLPKSNVGKILHRELRELRGACETNRTR